MTLTNTLIKKIRDKGHKLTKTRKAIVEILTYRNIPFSAPDIKGFLAQKDIAVNKTTVYREMEFLKNEGFVKEVDFGDGVKRYEITERDHHHHLVCICCKLIKDVLPDSIFEGYEKKMAREKNFQPLRHSLEFFGLCPACKTKPHVPNH